MEKSGLLFTPETPLGQDVQSLLLQHPEGLRLDEIRRLLVGKRVYMLRLKIYGKLLGNIHAFSLLPGDRSFLLEENGHLANLHRRRRLTTSQ